MTDIELTAALDEFRQALTPDQNNQLISSSNHTPTADDVVRLTEQVTQANADRKSRLFATRIQGFLESVQQYRNIIDTCTGPNQIAALVWGSIKLVLLVSSNFAEYFDKLSQRINQLSAYCPRLSEYERLFQTSTRLQQAISAFYAVVVKFCSKALRVVQERGVKRYSKSAWKSFKLEFKDIEEDISEAKDDVTEELRLASEQEAHIFRRLLTAEIEDNRKFRTEQNAEIQLNKDFRTQQTLELQRIGARQVQKIIKETERQQIRILQRIPTHDYAASLRRAQSLRCEGTCGWILSKSEFQIWIDQNGPKHLWCYGIPGCGKTVLMGYIIDHLRSKFSNSDKSANIFYFFDASDKTSLKAYNFLRCILHQVLKLEPLLPKIQRRLESLFMDQMDMLEPTTSELQEVFLQTFGKLKNGFLLIDGLDEADDVEQRNVKSFLKEVQKLAGARILITTHASLDISKVLTSNLTLYIRPECLKDDIEIFVQSQIDRYSQEEMSDCEPYVLDLIKQKLLCDAEGMFLWADLQLKAIVQCYEECGSPNSIPDILETLPQKITDLYAFLLARLAKEAGDRAESAKRAFQWAIYSERTLTIDELEEAISLFPNQTAWQSPSSKLNIPRLAKMCGNLVNYDEVNKTVSLAHHSVESFLLGFPCGPEIADFKIEENTTEQYLAEMCLTYLSFTDFHQALTRTSDTKYLSPMNRPIRLLERVTPGLIRPIALNAALGRRRSAKQTVDIVNVLRSELSTRQSKNIDPSYQLLEYCKTYWHSHARYIDLQDTMSFSKVQNFIHRTHLPKEWMPWSSIEEKDSLPVWNMFLWAVRNSHMVVFWVWRMIAKAPESEYWKCLWQDEGSRLFASACESANHTQLVMILGAKRIEDGVVRPSESEMCEGFLRASYLGHYEAVERLLQEKIDVNVRAAYGGMTALQLAAEGGHLAVVELLLQKKANVNAAASHGGKRALQAAAEGGHLAVVERLLQEKADVNAESEYDETTALQVAAAGSHFAVVERLLQEKADVNAIPTTYGGRTALQAAAEGGHLAVVERLLQENADVNDLAVGKGGRTALQAAAEGGHLAVVERLLQEHAYVHAIPTSEGGRTALQAAAGGGHLAVVERLLQENAQVNTKAASEDGRTALQAAAEGGHLAVVERLLEEKADVNAAAAGFGGGRTALQAAAGGGHLAVVERLLQENAQVNTEAASEGGRTALQAAAEGGHLVVVERLLQENADVNASLARYNRGRTALQAAAEGGYLAVVNRLLQENANVNAAAVGHNGRTALQAAAEGGHLAVVERLLQEKANVNAAPVVRIGGRTALQAAAEGGHLAVVVRLLQEKADVRSRTTGPDGGKTALDLAIQGGYDRVADCLRAAGAKE